MYYVRVPSTGAIINAMKSKVSSTDVSIDEDDAARQALLDEWKRSQGRDVLPFTGTEPHTPKPEAADKASNRIDPYRLQPGQTYRVSRETPLMPDFEPTNPLAALGDARKLPPSGTFEVVHVRIKNAKPWYEVRVPGLPRLYWVNATALLGQSLTHDPLKRNQDKHPDFKVVKREDVSFRDRRSQLIRRFTYRIEVPAPLAEHELRNICQVVIQREKALGPLNAIGFFFYLPGTDTSGHYTAGKADWAPNGKWEQADTIKQGDYSRHRLVLKTGSALGKRAAAHVTDIPKSRKKQVFHDLVAAQDRGVGDGKAYEEVAKKHGIDVNTVKEIAVEGVVEGWPMP